MSALADTMFMKNRDWRDRLADAIDDSGKSKRQVSLASDNGPGYVHSILSEGKDPTISKLIGVCKAIPASPLFIIHGVSVTPEQEAVITALEEAPELTDSVLSILTARSGS